MDLGIITSEYMVLQVPIWQTEVSSIFSFLTVETERWFKEFELMDGLRNLSFVGFVVFLRDIRYNLLRKLGETKP
jgi:hypothetical protein